VPEGHLLIELVGCPGAGKSTLAGALLGSDAGAPRGGVRRIVPPEHVTGRPRLALRGDVGRHVDLLLRSLVERLPGPAAHRVGRVLWDRSLEDPLAQIARSHPSFVSLVASAPPPPDADEAHVAAWRSWPAVSVARHLLIRGAPWADVAPQVVLVEEGLVQRANTVCAGDPSLVEAYLSNQPTPDVLIALTIDPEVALRRLRSRGGPTLIRHRGLDDRAVLRDLERTARLVEQACAVLPGRGVEVLVLDASAPVSQSHASVRGLVDRLVADRAE
jgi:hypothetical protein